jgi:hypothetical protein
VQFEFQTMTDDEASVVKVAIVGGGLVIISVSISNFYISAIFKTIL